MKKILLLVMVIFLVGCSAPVTEGTHMANYSAYLSTANSEYFGAYENSGHVDGYSYGYVGNNNTYAGFYLGFKLPSTFPQDGGAIGDYTVDADDITSAILRLPEVNKGTRGSSPLTLKIAAITGAWNADAAFNTLPAISAVVDSAVINNAIPSSSNWTPGTRDGYHAAVYRYLAYEGPTATGPWTLEISENITAALYNQYLDEWGGTVLISYAGGGGYNKEAITYTPAYYDYYYLYHDIDIINVIKDAVANGATGLLLYFDVSSANYDRKVFTTPLETADSRRPGIFITFTDGSGVTINCKGVYGGAAVTPGGFKGVYGGALVNVGGIKGVKTIDGVKTLVDVYRP
jgi:hypothetical protein